MTGRDGIAHLTGSLRIRPPYGQEDTMQIIFRLLDLQLFAEGDGGTAAEATGAAAETGDLSQVVYGKQQAEQAPDAGVQQEETPARDLGKEFEALIKGEFKDVYNKRVQDTVSKRLKGPAADAEKYRAMQPVMKIRSPGSSFSRAVSSPPVTSPETVTLGPKKRFSTG